MGTRRTRLPVAAKMALATAGMIAGLDNLADAGGELMAGHNVHFEGWRLMHAQQRIIRECWILLVSPKYDRDYSFVISLDFNPELAILLV